MYRRRGWYAGMIVTPTLNGKVHICVNLNVSIYPETHILISVEETLSLISGAISARCLLRILAFLFCEGIRKTNNIYHMFGHSIEIISAQNLYFRNSQVNKKGA